MVVGFKWTWERYDKQERNINELTVWNSDLQKEIKELSKKTCDHLYEYDNQIWLGTGWYFKRCHKCSLIINMSKEKWLNEQLEKKETPNKKK